MAVTAVVGAVGAYSAHNANENAKEQTKIAQQESQAARDLEAEALDFERQRYAEWQETYGSLEDNLGDYYNGLDPDDYRLRGFQAEKQRFQSVQEQIKKQFGNGESGSAAEQLALAQSTIASGQQLAAIDFNAERETAREQLSFLQLGLNKEAQIAGGITNNLNNSSNRAQSRSNQALDRADEFIDSRDNTVGTLVGTGLDFVRDRNGLAPSSSGGLI